MVGKRGGKGGRALVVSRALGCTCYVIQVLHAFACKLPYQQKGLTEIQLPRPV